MPSTRPGSGCSPGPSGTPMSWNSPSVKFGPTWQVRHCPRPTKILSPRRAGSGRAARRASSPALRPSAKASKGALRLTMRRW